MKKILLSLFIVVLVLSSSEVFAQGKGKGKGKEGQSSQAKNAQRNRVGEQKNIAEPDEEKEEKTQ